MKKLILAVLAPLLFSLPAHALFEIRAGYGLITPDSEVGSGNELKTVAGFNGDAIVELPMFPLGLGLRYEMMEYVVGTAGGNIDSEFNRLSVIANYRIIDLLLYLGFIGTIGVSNTTKIKDVTPGVTIEASKDLTFTAGVEGGVSLGLFMVGAELGYFVGGDYNVDSPSGYTADGINFDGIYGKVLVGVGF